MTRSARNTAVPSCLVAAVLSLAGTARAQSPLLEVESSNGAKLLHVNNDAGFLVKGQFGSGTIPATGAGVRLMWHPKQAALRAGFVTGSEWDEEGIGSVSVALGRNTRAAGAHSLALNNETLASGESSVAGGGGSVASGEASLAFGQNVRAEGPRAVAFGLEAVASGQQSFAAGLRTQALGTGSAALGEETKAASHALAAGFRSSATAGGSLAVGHTVVASGFQAAALGTETVASGGASFAAGAQTKALGLASVALGSGVTAQGDGSFVFGDRSVSQVLTAGPNQFRVRAAGGVSFFTGVNIGCFLQAGGGAWSCSSSKRVKEDFAAVDGEEILARLRQVPIQSWRYIGTEARHLGPFAEDFHAAFGLGADADKIAQIDADGVALSAVQALERRTAELLQRIEALEHAAAAGRP